MKVICKSCGYEYEIDGRRWSPRLPCVQCGATKLDRVVAEIKKDAEVKAPVQVVPPPIKASPPCKSCLKPLFELHNFNEACHLYICLNEDCNRYRQPQRTEKRTDNLPQVASTEEDDE
jgi:hypothetical protein